MIIVVYGEDELARSRRLKELREEADGGTGMLASNFDVIAGRDARPADILARAMAMPFLSAKRLIVVEDILDRFKAARVAQGGERTESRAIKQFEPLFEGLKGGIPESTMLVFTGGAAAQTHPFLKEIKGVGARLEEYPAIKAKELPRFVRQEAALYGVHFKNGPSRRPLPPEDEWRRPIETDPAVVLANLHQPISETTSRQVADTLSISQELQKLSLFAMGRDVTVDDVDEVCSGQREPSRWAFQDWVMDGDLAQSLNALEYFSRTDGSLQPILGLLMSGYRTLAVVVDLVAERASTAEIQKAIGRPWGEDRYIRRANALGRDGLRAAYEAMIAADRAIKAGEMDEEVAMSVCITRLCELARRKQPAGRR